jgi:translation initiation factor 1
MTRLFAGTPFDRPPRCERCGALEADCACPPVEAPRPPALAPERQTVRLRVEKRPKGKVVTVVAGIDGSNDLPALATRLKQACGTGGTVKEATIELQGAHLDRAETELAALGYRTRRG